MVGLPWVKPLRGGRGQLSPPLGLPAPSGPSSLADRVLPERDCDVPGALRRPSVPGVGPAVVSTSHLRGWGPRVQLRGGGSGGLQPAARLFVLSSKPCSCQALPAKVTRTFRRAGSKVASLLLSPLLISAHRKPSWVPFIPRISAQAEVAQNLRPLASPW